MATLRDRLAGLRGASSPAPAAAPLSSAVPSSLAERVARLGAVGAGRRGIDPAVLAEGLGGELIAPGLIRIERRLSLESVHGGVALADLRCADGRCFVPEAGKDLLFLDTETTGLAGGTGTLVFLLGLARLREEALLVCQFLLTGFAGEGALLAAARDWSAGCDTLVSYNGRSFDVPLLSARCRLAGHADPFAPLVQLDLLHPTRRAFARRWPDCRLQTAERRLLGFSRTDDLPGAMAPQAWFDWVRRGAPDLLAGVVEHNHWDLVSLAALLPALEHAYRDPAAAGADLLALARHQLRRGDAGGACRTLDAVRTDLDRPGLLALALLHRRAGRWTEAVAIWEELAAQDEPEALERLAKYHEHVARDFARALGYARRLAGLAVPRSAVVHDRRLVRLRERLLRQG